MPHSRVSLIQFAPDLDQTVVQLDRQIKQIAESAGIDKSVGHLVRLRASQRNQCAFCVRMLARDAAADKDYRLTVLSDLCADADSAVHKVLLEKVFPVVTTCRARAVGLSA